MNIHFASKQGLQRACIVTVLLITHLQLPAQVMSDEVIYANGQQTYAARNWRYAAVYLFAYIQKNPASMSNETFRKEVVKAFDFSMEQLNQQTQEVNRLRNQVANYQKNVNSELGVSEQGLESSPPPLRNPSLVPKKSTYVRPAN
ncbi:MAG: hypothetical protein EOO14_15515 [Chitinophagaceae bacterium]|nr:MAG: hypothetical protein EOO14_15515 [Chitinophagaceae bacterium]